MVPMWALQKTPTAATEMESWLLLCLRHRAAEQSWNMFLRSPLQQLENAGNWKPALPAVAVHPGRAFPPSRPPRTQFGQAVPPQPVLILCRDLLQAEQCCRARAVPAEDREQAHRLPFCQCPDFSQPLCEACLAACCGTTAHLSARISKALSDTTPSPPKIGSPLSDTSKYRFLRTTDSNNLIFRGVRHNGSCWFQLE